MQDSKIRPKVTSLSHLVRSAIRQCTRKRRSQPLPKVAHDSDSQRSGQSSVPSTSKIILPHFADSNIGIRSYLKAQSYLSATSLDDIRRIAFNRLGDQVYVDYMGGCLAPEQLIRWHLHLLQTEVLGNTHSVSQR